MQKYCTKCGVKLNDKTGECPNCGWKPSKKEVRAAKSAQKKADKKAAKKEKWRKLPLKQKFKKICLRFLLIILALMLVTGGAAGTLVYFNIVDIPIVSDIFHFFGISGAKTNDKDTSDDAGASDGAVSDGAVPEEIDELNKEIEKALEALDNQSVDADSYFRSNSSIVSETEADASAYVRTEAEVYSDLVGRGFTGSSIQTSYSMSGEYFLPVTISETSSAKHPYYEAAYTADNGNEWSIIEINGEIMANPVSYNMQSGHDVQLIISESETVTSYDGKTNKFYETIPNSSELIVKTVSRIDAETLKNLTFGEIDRL